MFRGALGTPAAWLQPLRRLDVVLRGAFGRERRGGIAMLDFLRDFLAALLGWF